jgi:allantoinase
MIAAVHLGVPGSSRLAAAKAFLDTQPGLAVLDYDDAVVGPGLIDVHVHMNEPGREEWEGERRRRLAALLRCAPQRAVSRKCAGPMLPAPCSTSSTLARGMPTPHPSATPGAGIASGTAAAAAGGITTVVDMPLNSAPCTTTPRELARKAAAAAAPNKAHVNVAFWAGLVPDNARQPGALRALVRGGALGFKAFMAPSGIDDFPPVSPEEVEAALPTLRALGVPLLVHAEMVDGDVPQEVGGGGAPAFTDASVASA